MSAAPEVVEADVCVIGAGIVGLAHALEARRRGLTVVVVDRDQRAVGASVRNFGHLFFTGLGAGEPFECGLRARERWLELAPRAGLFFQTAGTVIVARADDELELLTTLAADPQRQARVLTPAEVGELAPVPTEGIVGGLHGTLDLRTDPRTAVAGLARLLSDDPGARIAWGTHVHDVQPGTVHATDLTVTAPAIIACPGPDYRSLPPAIRSGLEPLTSCQLQMLRVAAPLGRHYRTALATGLSLVRYPGFANQPAAAQLRARLQAERPELLEAGIHLLITQLPDGDLVIGDTHTYGDTLEPFGVERLNELLLAEACKLLGTEELTVRERWHGIYPTMSTGTFLVTAPLPGVRVVENVAGLGMTMALGQAPLVLDELLATVPA